MPSYVSINRRSYKHSTVGEPSGNYYMLWLVVFRFQCTISTSSISMFQFVLLLKELYHTG